MPPVISGASICGFTPSLGTAGILPSLLVAAILNCGHPKLLSSGSFDFSSLQFVDHPINDLPKALFRDQRQDRLTRILISTLRDILDCGAKGELGLLGRERAQHLADDGPAHVGQDNGFGIGRQFTNLRQRATITAPSPSCYQELCVRRHAYNWQGRALTGKI